MAENNDLKRFVSASEPGTPASEEAYVPRIPDVRGQLRASLLTDEKSRVLLLGQTGVGKSTELWALARELPKKRFFSLVPPIDAGLDLGAASWHEIFLFTALHALNLFKHGEEALPDDIQRIVQVATPRALLDKMRHEAQALRAQFANAQFRIWEYASEVVARLAGERDRELVILWDGLEKLPPGHAKQLFLEQGRFIEQLPCKAVITAPLSLRSEVYFAEIEQQFNGGTLHVRAFSPFEALGQALLIQILGRRGYGSDPSFKYALDVTKAQLLAGQSGVSNPLLENINILVNTSGGLPRQLLQLAGEAAKLALATGSGTILPVHVSHGAQRLSERFRYLLEPGDLDSLRLPDEKRPVAVRARLIQLGALIEYDHPTLGVERRPNPLLATMLAQSSPT